MTALGRAGWALLAVAAAVRVSNALHYPMGWGFDEIQNWRYVSALVEAWHLPAPDADWSTAHPPLFYWIAAALGRYLYEPHNVVLAAKLTGALCSQHGLLAVSPGIAYLTSDALVADAALDPFEVRDVRPFDQKQLKAWCREHHIGRLEVKKRGVEFDPESLRKSIIDYSSPEAPGSAPLPLPSPLDPIFT